MRRNVLLYLGVGTGSAETRQKILARFYYSINNEEHLFRCTIDSMQPVCHTGSTMQHEKKRGFITIPELAKIIGLSRSQTFRKVKSGDIPSQKVGRMFLISQETVKQLKKEEFEKDKKIIEIGVKRVIEEYGEVLKKLGRDEKVEFDDEFKKWIAKYSKRKEKNDHRIV